MSVVSVRRMFKGFEMFRLGQAARKRGAERKYTWNPNLSERDNLVFQHNFLDGWDKPNKK